MEGNGPVHLVVKILLRRFVEQLNEVLLFRIGHDDDDSGVVQTGLREP